MVSAASSSLLTAALLAVHASAAPPIVSSTLQSLLLSTGAADIVVTFKQGVADPLNAIDAITFTDRGEKINQLVKRLENHAQKCQKSIESVLALDDTKKNKRKMDNRIWISNQMLIRGASADLVQQLSLSPDVSAIREEINLPTPEIKIATINITAVLPQATTNQWGINLIGAPGAWALGYTGQNVVVGSIDTGVMANHSALQANWRSTNGWFDPPTKEPLPYDDQGHGTHTVGTIVGLNGIGVAPGAKFISCRACTKNGCLEGDLLACAQFMICPTAPDGVTGPDCKLAPSLVSNSWAGGQGSNWFASAISAWRTAGIIPIFANGNGGPACKTANSPGDSTNVIAVGSTNVNDALSSFSSKGPSVNGVLKPDITAPGENVLSAWTTDTSSYLALSGTSMATPHVAGVVALMLSKRPTLTYDKVKSALTATTTRSTLKTTGYRCQGTSDTKFPNNQYGYGRINSLSAVNGV